MAVALWRGLDGHRLEIARAEWTGSDLRASGTQIGVAYELRYELEPGFLRVEVVGEVVRDVRLDGADFFDLGFSPLFNSLPVVRDGLLDGGPERDYVMRWVEVPSLDVSESAQRYEPVDTRTIRFRAGEFTALVELRPGRARRALRRAGGAIALSERLRLWLERGVSGYRLRDAATGEVVRWEDPRIRVVAAAGVSYRPEALPDPSFDPPRRLALVPEPTNEHDPNAVAIWNEERTLQVGYVPAAVAPELAGDEQALSLWRVEGGLRVLIAPADAWIGTPR